MPNYFWRIVNFGEDILNHIFTKFGQPTEVILARNMSSSYYNCSIAVLTLKFDLDTSKVNGDIWHKFSTSAQNVTITFELSRSEFIYAKFYENPTCIFRELTTNVTNELLTN